MRIGIQTSDFNYNVIQTPASGVNTREVLDIIESGNGSDASKLATIQAIMQANKNSGFLFNRREDNGAYLGLVTKDYAIVQNSDLVNAVEEAISLRKHLGNFERRVAVMGQGEKCAVTYTFTGYHKKLARVGDSVGFSFTIRNSFDRNWQAAIIGGLIKLACANGMTTLAKELSLLQRHSSKLSLAFVGEMIDRAIQSFNGSLAHFERMASLPVSQEQGRNVIAYALQNYPVISTATAREVFAIWEAPTYKEDSERNVMSLYSAFTQHLRDEPSYMKSARVGDAVAKMFRDAIHKAEFMAEILASRDTSELIEV
jgi:hypothetical protein